MKKIAICSLLLGLGFVCNGFAAPDFNKYKCKVTSCTEGGDTKGYKQTVLRTDGKVGYGFSSGTCYRCNWGDDQYECPVGAVIAIGHQDYRITGEIKSFWTCTEDGVADDDWLETNPNYTCPSDSRAMKEFAQKMRRDYVIMSGAAHTTSHFIMGDGLKTGEIKDRTGDNLVLSSGEDGCVVYLCEKGYKADADHRECIPESAQPNNPNGVNCTTPGTELATRSITVVATVCTGAPCLAIEAGKCYDREYLRCMEAVDEKEKVVWNTNQCLCTEGNGKEFNYNTKKCEKNPSGKTCEQLFPNGSAERLACCRAGSATTWSGSATSGTCTCKSGTWTYQQGALRGECVQGNNNNNNNNPVLPVDQVCSYQFDADIICANGFRLSKHTFYPFNVKTNGKTCDQFRQMYGNDQAFILEMMNKYCAIYGSAPVVPDDRAFNAAKSSIDSFFTSARSTASVWKNSEGKFNTARLASDLTAGVVLGTVGGVVSGVVIKKKQIEKGFDALHCTVGGQKVADWGDEFNIGLRR